MKGKLVVIFCVVVLVLICSIKAQQTSEKAVDTESRIKIMEGLLKKTGEYKTDKYGIRSNTLEVIWAIPEYLALSPKNYVGHEIEIPVQVKNQQANHLIFFVNMHVKSGKFSVWNFWREALIEAGGRKIKATEFHDICIGGGGSYFSETTFEEVSYRYLDVGGYLLFPKFVEETPIIDKGTEEFKLKFVPGESLGIVEFKWSPEKIYRVIEAL